VAEAYLGLGVRDEAHDHYRRALRIDSTAASAYEGLARIWRDWGFPHLALGDAYRAVHYAPVSGSARNTLGTILQALGKDDAAERAYVDALVLDAGAAYALNNLCYLSLKHGVLTRALEECQIALLADPTLKTARYNLADVYTARGEPALAKEQRDIAADPVMDSYNAGLHLLNRRSYAEAGAAFFRACRARPSFVSACSKAEDARVLAEAEARREK
jgi:tetratricopeptide (TPR) repeat protein